MLPKPPSWKCREIVIEGGTTSNPIKFFYRDGLECLLFLFGNPVFHGRIELKPYKLFEDDQQKIQVFNEPFTGKLPWRIQVRRKFCSFLSFIKVLIYFTLRMRLEKGRLLAS